MATAKAVCYRFYNKCSQWHALFCFILALARRVDKNKPVPLFGPTQPFDTVLR